MSEERKSEPPNDGEPSSEDGEASPQRDSEKVEGGHRDSADGGVPNEAVGSKPEFSKTADAILKHFEVYKKYLLAIANDEVSSDWQAKEGASDLVQETQFKVLKNYNQFRGTTLAELEAWFCTILRNHIHDKRKDCRDQNVAERKKPPAISGSDGISSLDIKLQRQREAMDRLKYEDREILEMRYTEKLSYPEIAKRLGLTEDGARRRHGRAIKRMRKELDLK